MKRVLVLGITMGLVLGLAGLAVASPANGPARLSGSFQTRVKVTELSHFAGFHVGETRVVMFSFKPRCAAGGCTTVLRRHTFGGQVSVEILHAVGSGYVGSVSQTAACSAPDGQARTSDGYTVKLSLSVLPTDVTAGKAHAFSGAGTVVGTPTASGRADRCPASSERFTFKTEL
jgi:hypothetical protein